MSIDWETFSTIEQRMARNNESANNSTDLLELRLQHVQTENTPEDCHQELLTLSDIKTHIENQAYSPFHDIPNLPEYQYSDNELDFWAAFIAEYREVVARCPKYASTMIWSGIPPALRGKAWISMCEAHSKTFESLYDSLAAEWTPFVKIIGRDLNRTFPEISMFQEKNGEGQSELGRVLRAYSAYDMQVGYCQGLTFLAGPLLLHMSDKEAFCVLVKLMEDYNVRSMFTADMSGLHLRMYQFESLLAKYLPELSQHFDNLGVNSIYASQWFLSFFAVTCPLAMLVRIYDLVFAEGAVVTLMRVALAVLKRNQKMLLQFDDEEQILQHLLGRQLWDAYGYDADVMVTDITSIGWDTLKCLQSLESEYKGEGLGVQRSKSKCRRHKSTKKTGYAALASRFSLWSNNSTPSLGSSLTRSDSKVSIGSSESEFTNQSSASSVTSFDDTITEHTEDVKEYEVQISDMKLQLDRTRLALDSERRARQADKEAIEAMVANMTQIGGDGMTETLNQVKARFGITTESIQEASNSSKCNSCERYLMELAAVKTSEAMVRQELDELNDKMHRSSSGNLHQHTKSDATITTTPKKGWLWG